MEARLDFEHFVDGEREVTWVDIRYQQSRPDLEARLAEVPGMTLPPAPEPPPATNIRPGGVEGGMAFFVQHASLMLEASRAYAARHGIAESDSVMTPPPETMQLRFDHGHDPAEREATYRTVRQELWVEYVPGEAGHRFTWENGTVVDLPGRPAQVRAWDLHQLPAAEASSAVGGSVGRKIGSFE